MFKPFVVLAFLACLLTAFVTGCISAGFSREGTVVPIEEPAKKARAKALVQFNKGTALLEAARDANTGEVDSVKVDQAIAAFEEAARLDPADPETQKQLGIVYEFFKQDEKTAYMCYKKHKDLGGTDRVILEAVKELEHKYKTGNPGTRDK